MDEQHCLEKFVLAKQGDRCAQQWFQRRFSGILRDWFDHHPYKEAACRVHSEQFYLDGAFQAAWEGPFDAAQMEFDTLSTVLRYLAASLNGQILDALRAVKSPGKSSIVQVREEHKKDVADARELWERLEALLLNQRERRLGYLLFHCGFKPTDIVQAYPQEFNDLAEISQVRLTIMRYGRGEVSKKT
jgi:hypothetical protein